MFLHIKRTGFTKLRCSYIYSSVARLKSMSFDSACKMSMCPGVPEMKEGNDSTFYTVLKVRRPLDDVKRRRRLEEYVFNIKL